MRKTAVTDYIHFVLGEFESSQAQTHIQRPHQKIVNRETGEWRAAVSDVPDLVLVHGILQSSAIVSPGAPLAINYKTGPPFPGSDPFVWIITGEKGRIRVSCPRGPLLNVQGTDNPIVIEIEDFETGEVGKVEWEWEEWQTSLPGESRNVAKLYDLFYEGRGGESGACDFVSAVQRHVEIDKILW